MQVADNNINKQQKFYSLRKRYSKIRRFEQKSFSLAITDEGHLLKTSNMFVSFRYSEQSFCCLLTLLKLLRFKAVTDDSARSGRRDTVRGVIVDQTHSEQELYIAVFCGMCGSTSS